MLKRKMVRDPLSPERVAAGWALGMFIGCSIPFGMQLIISVPLAVLLRVSKIGATLGTFLTNPVTIFFIYPAQTMATGWLLGRNFTWDYILKTMQKVAEEGNWKSLLSLSGDVVLCFFLGGVMLAFILSPITYFAVKSFVMRRRKRRVCFERSMS